jgi:hypothetical protein
MIRSQISLVAVLLMSAAPAFGQTSNSTSDGTLSPIQTRSTEILQRYVSDLAARHNLPLADLRLTTRTDLAKAYMELLQTLSAVPKEQFTEQDYRDIGLLTREFDDVYDSVHGRLTMTVMRNQQTAPSKEALPQKLQEWNDRFKALENVKVSGDFCFFPQNDFGRSVRMSMASNMRGRINVTAKVFEAPPEAKLGDGYLFMRLTAASGRFFPRNKFLMSPTNDINDAAASPFNSGINDVQLSNLIINNNNSNSIRPTTSMEQMYYTQDLRFSPKLKGNYKAGLIYFGNMFDNNNFANSEHLQFANTSFVNSIAWRPNFVGPATVLQLERSILREKAFLRGTVGMITLTDRDYFGSAGLNYEVQAGHKFFGKEGNVRAGMWHHSFRAGTKTPFVTPPDITGTSALSLLPGGTTNASRPVGMYMNFDQRIWKDIGLWGRYAMNDKQFGEVILGGLLSSRASWSCGAEIPARLVFKKRKNDVFGIAYGQVLPYSRERVTPATPAFISLNGIPATTLDAVDNNLAIINPGRHHRTEKVLEAYYRYQLNNNVSVSPDVQYIWSPGATGPQPGILVLGSRLTVTF